MKKKRVIATLTMLLAVIAIYAQEGVSFLVHSSGNVLGINAENRAVLDYPESKSVYPLTLIKQQDGSYVLALEGDMTRCLSLGTANGWSTYFLDNASDARAHYTIEKSGSYVKLKNKHTNGYLGTDESGAGALVYSDKNGSDKKHMWRLSDSPVVELTADTVSYAVSADARRQVMEGWGVSLCWWANMCGKWNEKKIDQLIDWMVSPEGLNWNVFRYNIGGGDDPKWTNCYPHHMGNGKGLRAEMEGQARRRIPLGERCRTAKDNAENQREATRRHL